MIYDWEKISGVEKREERERPVALLKPAKIASYLKLFSAVR